MLGCASAALSAAEAQAPVLVALHIPPKAQPGTLQHWSICLGGIQRRYMRLCRREMMRRPQVLFLHVRAPQTDKCVGVCMGTRFSIPRNFYTMC